MKYVDWVYMSLLATILIAGDLRAKADPADVSALVSGVRALGYEIPEFAQMSAACDGDAMCAARFLKDSIGPGAEIVPADTSRPARTGWSNRDTPLRVAPEISTGAIVIELARFDSSFLSTVFNRLAILPKKIILDVRGLAMSDELGELRRTVSLFTGKRDRAFRLIYPSGRQVDWQIPQPPSQWGDIDITVRVNDQTPGNGS